MSHEQSFLSTNQLAKLMGVKPGSIHRALTRCGHYLGIRPVKLPNQRLRWSAAAAEAMLAGDAK